MKDEELKYMIKETVREVLKEERLIFHEILIPYVTKKELDEIHKKFDSPKKYIENDFVDMTDWINEWESSLAGVRFDLLIKLEKKIKNVFEKKLDY